MWNFCQGRASHQLFSLLREFYFFMACILSLHQKAQRTCWDVPAALSGYPAQGCPAATEFQWFCVLPCSCVVCAFPGTFWWIWKMGMESGNSVDVLVLSESSKWGFAIPGSTEYLPSLLGDEWLFELNFVPALPSFIKHLMMTELAIKSWWFQFLEGNVFQWLYLDCFQPRRENGAGGVTCSISFFQILCNASSFLFSEQYLVDVLEQQLHWWTLGDSFGFGVQMCDLWALTAWSAQCAQYLHEPSCLILTMALWETGVLCSCAGSWENSM